MASDGREFYRKHNLLVRLKVDAPSEIVEIEIRLLAADEAAGRNVFRPGVVLDVEFAEIAVYPDLFT